MGFEPTRAEPIGLAVQRLNHSATSSWRQKVESVLARYKQLKENNILKIKFNQRLFIQKYFPRRELNPGLLGESQLSQPLDHVGYCFRPGSNRRPSACQADVITATPRKLLRTLHLNSDLTSLSMTFHRLRAIPSFSLQQVSLAVIVQWLGPCVVAAVTQVRILVTAVTFLFDDLF